MLRYILMRTALTGIASLVLAIICVLPSSADVSVSIDIIRESGRFTQFMDSGRGEYSVTRSTRESGSELRLTTDPPGAEIHVDGRYRGTSPQAIDLSPGVYHLRVERRGYYPLTFRVAVGDRETVRASVRLAAVTGLVALERDPEDTEILLDGRRLSGRYHVFQEGQYRLEARRFGYVTERQTLRVARNRVTEVSVRLRPAPFELSNFSSSRSVLRPQNPSPWNTTVLRFRASGPGSAEITIEDRHGNTVRRFPRLSLTQWDHRVVWDGRNEYGEVVEDGAYTVVVRGEERSGEMNDLLTGTVEVSQSARIAYRTSLGGGPGTVYGSTPSALPPGGVQFSLLSGAGIDKPIVPLATLFRFAPGPFELFASLGTNLSGRSDDNHLRLGGGIDIPVYRGSMLQHSVRVSGEAVPIRSKQGDAPFRNDSAGAVRLESPLLFEVRGPLALATSPGVRLTFDEDTSVRGELSMAVLMDLHRALFALSARSDTRFLEQSHSFDIETAVEAHLQIASTPLFVSTWGTGVISEGVMSRIFVGAGLGVLW